MDSDLDFDTEPDDLGPQGFAPDAHCESSDDLGPAGFRDEEPGILVVVAPPAQVSAPDSEPELVPEGEIQPRRRSELSFWLRPSPGAQLDLARCLQASAPVTRQWGTQQDIAALEELAFGSQARKAAPLTVEAERLNMDVQQFTKAMTEFTSATFHCVQLACKGWLAQVRSHIARGAKPIVAWTKLMYDETPVLLRAADKAPGEVAGKTEKCVAKVFQAEAAAGFLLESGGRFLNMRLPLPITLSAMDHCTAENTIARMVEALQVPGLADTLALFPHINEFSASDRASSNNKAEGAKTDARGGRRSRLRTTCGVHKAYSAQGVVHDCVPAVVSGQINFSLAMRPGGAVQTLRETLDVFFRCRLRVYRGARPPGPGTEEWAHRQATLKLFLGHDEGHRGLQRALKLSVLNGNWLLPNVVEHYCLGCCANDEETLKTCTDFVTRALLPSACPQFPRSRWTRANLSVNFTGLLTNVHSILQQITPVWLRALSDAKKPPLDGDFQLDDGADTEEEDLGPQGFMAFEDGNAEGDGGVDDRGASAPVPEAQQDAAQLAVVHLSDIDWKQVNAQARTGAKEFVALPNLRCDLVLLRQCMEPSHLLVCKLLKFTSEKWITEHLDATLAERRVLTPIEVCASGQMMSGFFQHIEDRLFGDFWDAVPPSERSTRASLVAFKMLSCSAGAAAALLHHEFQECYPYRLFHAILSGDPAKAAEAVDDPPCIRDPYSHDHCRRYPGDQLLGVASKMELSTSAAESDVHIGRIEARHATIRRLILRAVQTWSRTLPQISGDFFLLQQRLLMQDVASKLDPRKLNRRRRPNRRKAKSRTRKKPPSTKKRAVRHRAQEVERGRYGKKGTSSSWKSFYSQERRGKPGLPSREERQEIREKYASLSEADTARLRQDARKRTRQIRTSLDPGAAEIIRAQRRARHLLAILDAPFEDVTHAAQGTLSMVLANTQPLPEKIRSLRRHLLALSRADRNRDEAKRQRVQEEVLALPMPPDVRPLADITPAALASNLMVVPMVAGGYEQVEFRPVAPGVARCALERAPGCLLDSLRQNWADRHTVRRHQDAAPMPEPQPIPPVPGHRSYHRHRKCEIAGRCLHKGLGYVIDKFCAALTTILGHAFKAKTPARAALKRGDVVYRFQSSSQDCWFHCAWLNLNTWHLSLRQLFPNDDPVHLARAAPHQALVFRQGDGWEMMWQAFAKLDLSQENQASFWLLHGNDATPMRRIRPAEVQVKCMMPSMIAWAGPPERHRRRRRRRIADSDSDREGVEEEGGGEAAAIAEGGAPEGGRRDHGRAGEEVEEDRVSSSSSSPPASEADELGVK